MKLRFTPNPNYIDKVLVVAHEAGLLDRLEFVPTSPFNPDTDLAKDNPLGKVPTLILDDGEAIFGGPVICEYLDSLHAGPKMFPPSGRRRWTVLRQMMLAEGVFDAAVLLDIESWRPRGEHRQDMVLRLWQKIVKALDRMERDASGYRDFDIGQICAAGALSRLDYRVHTIGEALEWIDPSFAWRDGRPVLAAWYAEILKRPSMTIRTERT